MARDLAQMADSWRTSLAAFTDTHAGDPTRWSSYHLKATRIDRIQAASPGWCLPCCKCCARTLRDPLTNRRGPSDRTPFLVGIAAASVPPRSPRPLPAWVCRSSIFANLLDKMPGEQPWAEISCWGCLDLRKNFSAELAERPGTPSLLGWTVMRRLRPSHFYSRLAVPCGVAMTGPQRH